MSPATLVALLSLASSVAEASEDPDRLYAYREHLPSALEAADLWRGRLADGARDFEAAWKLARACYWLGSHVAADERRQQYERGVEAAKRAVALDEHRPEGHFWMATNMGALAESLGLGAGIKYRSAILKGDLVLQRRPRVLIVDDDQLVLAALRVVLGLETDYLVSLESDPRAALEIVSKTEVDVVISDFLMPHMDGLSFLEKVRRLRPAARLILLTGHADRKRVNQAVLEIGLEYMEKPWSNEALVRSLRSALTPS